ncbi:MAG: hypothetical protein N3G21_11700 [Candidatus Hydrogenedentes bacterium]|nr:hypothetical protein [Candidatus Hydrogenedentota bacterium]
MDEVKQNRLVSLEKWTNEQLIWLRKQIETMESIKKHLQIDNSIDFIEKYIDEIILQNDKLVCLIQEFELIKKDLTNEFLTKNALFAEKKVELTNLINKLMGMNQEVFDKILAHRNQNMKDMEKLLSYKERFEKYSGSDSNSYPGNRVSYET